MAEDKRPYHERYRPAPLPDYMRYLVAPVQRYLDRGNMIASEGWEQANRGSEQVRGGDLPGGIFNMLLGPANAVAAPITALLPTEGEIQSGPYPEWSKPGLAASMAAAGMFLPGPKGMGVAKGRWARPVTKERGNLVATPEHVRNTLEESGLNVSREENSVADASLSKYLFADTPDGRKFKVRISDHNYLAPEFGADIRYGEKPESIAAKIKEPLRLYETWKAPDPLAPLHAEAKLWAERLGIKPHHPDAMAHIYKAIQTGSPTNRMRAWLAEQEK